MTVVAHFFRLSVLLILFVGGETWKELRYMHAWLLARLLEAIQTNGSCWLT